MSSGRLTELRGGLQPPAPRASDSVLSAADQIVTNSPYLSTLSMSSRSPLLRGPEVLAAQLAAALSNTVNLITVSSIE